MWEVLIGLSIVLALMSLVLVLVGLLSNVNGAYRSFFIIMGFWFLFLSLNIIREGAASKEYFAESRQFDQALMNSSGTPVLFNKLNLSSNTTRYVNLTNGTLNLLDTANFSWMWIAIIITAMEIIHLIILALSNFGGNDKPPINVKPL